MESIISIEKLLDADKNNNVDLFNLHLLSPDKILEDILIEDNAELVKLIASNIQYLTDVLSINIKKTENYFTYNKIGIIEKILLRDKFPFNTCLYLIGIYNHPTYGPKPHIKKILKKLNFKQQEEFNYYITHNFDLNDGNNYEYNKHLIRILRNLKNIDCIILFIKWVIDLAIFFGYVQENTQHLFHNTHWIDYPIRVNIDLLQNKKFIESIMPYIEIYYCHKFECNICELLKL